ncbi:endolytic transglycosylase MltG [Sediminibacillus massiliensis]|uniref:endolytic transglycosylase MltG n=1 Tax=Sediminibacillus massiliensis TaxID=1926277 RepID=UPI0009888AE4|nr:endolytic transglycosylase MltG [Sediminibacillus massiliensis]
MSTSDKGDQYKDKFKQRVEEASTVRKIVAIVLSCLILILVAGTIAGYMYVTNALEPVNPGDDTTKSVEIPLGSSTSEIAGILEEEGIINNSLIFRFYVKFNNVTEFQAGDYEFTPSMSISEVIDALQTGTVLKEPVISVTIPEGKNVEEIAAIFSEKTGLDKEEFINRTEDPDYVQSLIDKHPSILSEEILDPEIRYPLEGYLFAATYEFYTENPEIDKIIEDMVTKTENVVTPYLDSISAREDIDSVHEALTMASLVEKEARTEEDRKLIAGVFYNRLEEDMMLQTDPTVLYAQGEHKDRVLFEDLKTESPYNTYQITGLPVGPISNFGESSLKSILNPEDTSYMYFVAAPDGEVYYSETYEKHQQLTQEYLNRDAAGE